MTTPTHLPLLSPAERFGQLRSLLHHAPSAAGWASIAALLPGWEVPQLRDEILPYLAGFWSAWRPIAHLPLLWLDACDDMTLDLLAPLVSRAVFDRELGVDLDVLEPHIRRAGEGGWLRHLRDVRLFMPGLDAEDVLGWLGTSALEVLVLDESDVSADTCERLAAEFLQLRRLGLLHNGLDDDDVACLLPQLEALDLSHSSTYETHDPPLWDFEAPHLRALKLRRTLGEPPFGAQLATSQALVGLTALDVSDHLLRDEDILALTQEAAWRLRLLDISCNEQCTPARTVEALERALMPDLEVLGVANMIGGDTDRPVSRLVGAPFAGNLRVLDAGVRAHMPEDIEALFTGFPALEALRLQRCDLDEPAIEALLRTTASATLRALDLRDPPLRLISNDAHVEALTRAPWLPQLERLDLRLEDPGHADARLDATLALASALHQAHPTLQILTGAHTTRSSLEDEREGWSLDEMA